jgi:hypothetical protein
MRARISKGIPTKKGASTNPRIASTSATIPRVFLGFADDSAIRVSVMSEEIKK